MAPSSDRADTSYGLASHARRCKAMGICAAWRAPADSSSRHAKRQPVLVIKTGPRQVGGHLRPRSDAAHAKAGESGIGEAHRAIGIRNHPVLGMAAEIDKHAQLLPGLDLHLGPELVHFE